MRNALIGLMLLACGCSGGSVTAPVTEVVIPRGNVEVLINPVAGAAQYRIEVVDPISLEPVHPELVVNSSGRHLLADVPPGHWRLRVHALMPDGTLLQEFYSFLSVHPEQQTSVSASNFLELSSPDIPKPFPFRVEPSPPDLAALNQVQYFIIVYMENQSFDGMFPFYPNADGVQFAGAKAVQKDLQGKVIPGYTYTNSGDTFVQSSQIATKATAQLPGLPYDLAPLGGAVIAPTSALVGDMVHQFVNQQRQINGGAMDLVAAWSNNPGLVQSYYDSNALGSPIATMARSGVLCDHFFHSAFGNTWHNEFWFFSGGAPLWFGGPKPEETINLEATSPTDPTLTRSLAVIGGQTYIVQFPPDFDKGPVAGQTLQNAPTVGDRLSEAGVSWTFYGSADPEINPFLWFQNFQRGTPGYLAHFKDKNPDNAQDFVNDATAGTLPQVSFVRPDLDESEHPDISTFDAGQDFLNTVVGAVRANPAIWNQCAIIITFDEQGGRWDHVSPPPIAPDRLGPGMRVPTLVLSPFVTPGKVDHTVYESVSVPKTLQLRYGLAPLTQRVTDATDMSGAFQP